MDAPANDDGRTIRPAPEGWLLRLIPGTFGEAAGPFYFREAGKTPGVGFFSEQRHRNIQNFVHGGALLTLADIALFDICARARGQVFRAVTVSLSSEFLAPGPIGAFIEATGEMTGGGKSLMFCRGLVSADGKALLSFAGILKAIG